MDSYLAGDAESVVARVRVGNPAALEILRALFDTAQRVRELDLAFETMWQRHRAGLPPESFAVPRTSGAGA